MGDNNTNLPHNTNDTTTQVLGNDPVDKSTGLNVNSIPRKSTSPNLIINRPKISLGDNRSSNNLTGGEEFKESVKPYQNYIPHPHMELGTSSLDEERAKAQ